MTDPKRPPPTLLSLPYDIRYLIYQHALPPGSQIYIQANANAISSSSSTNKSRYLQSFTAVPLPSSFLLVCREANSHLYNSYLFNIVGTKVACLNAYPSFLATLKRHARPGEEIHLEAFSNGEHSDTMAISMYVGEGKERILKRRQRGVQKSIEEIWEEVRRKEREREMWPPVGDVVREILASWRTRGILGGLAAVVGVIAWVIVR